MPGRAQGAGPVEFAVIGEAPGRTEDEQGQPFVGRAGKFLRGAFEFCEFPLDRAFFTNVVRCRPPYNATPAKEAARHCTEQWLRPELAEYSGLKAIILLGRTAAEAFGYPYSIARCGYLGAFRERDDVHVFIAPHPAFLLRQPSQTWRLINVLERVKTILYGGADNAAPDYRIVRSDTDLAEMERELGGADIVAWDIETTGLEPVDPGAAVLTVQFSARPGTGWLLPIDHPERAIPRDMALQALERLLNRPGLVGHNLKFVMRYVVTVLGIEACAPVGDTMIMAHLLDEEASRTGGNSLKTLARRYTGMGGYETALEDEGGISNIERMSLEALAPYACGDADATLRLYHIFQPMLKEQDLLDTLRLELDKMELLIEMERNGALADVPRIITLEREYPGKIAALRAALEEFKEIQDAIQLWRDRAKSKAVCGFNPDSFQQRTLLFQEVLRLPVLERIPVTSSGNISTGKDARALWIDALEHLTHIPTSQCAVDILKALDRCIKIRTLYTTYVKKLRGYVRRDGRIHTRFNGAKVVTFRLSSEAPNLQNLPRSSDDLPERGDIKQVFIAPDQHMLLAADYSQIELRIAALISQDPVMLRCIATGLDLHRVLASRIYSVPPEIKETVTMLLDAIRSGVPLSPELVRSADDALSSVITAKMRSQAKGANFGAVYMIGANTLATKHLMTLEQASFALRQFWQLFAGYGAWVERTKQEIYKTMQSRSLFGHVRHLLDIRSEDQTIRTEAERAGINYPIQSTASNLTLQAGVRLMRALRREGLRSRIFLQIHDELVLECPDEEVDRAAALTRRVMEDCCYPWLRGEDPRFPVVPPITVDLKAGRDLAGLKKFNTTGV